MGLPVPAIIVPGFYGYLLDDEPSLERGAGARLAGRWLAALEGRDGDDLGYQLAVPDEAVVCRELPPDPGLEVLAGSLPHLQDADRLFLFAYDWRSSLLASAARLAEEVGAQCDDIGVPEADLIAFGAGGLLVRYMLESGTLAHGAKHVRRVVHIGTPNCGVPLALKLLVSSIAAHGDANEAIEDILSRFPCAVQLLPPRGTAFLAKDGQPGVRVEPLAWPSGFFRGATNASPPTEEALRELVSCNESLHGALKGTFHVSWRRTLAFASSSEDTVSEMSTRLSVDRASLLDGSPTPRSGDGLVPIRSGLPSPSVRSVVVTGRHVELASAEGLRLHLRQFLDGPLA